MLLNMCVVIALGRRLITLFTIESMQWNIVASLPKLPEQNQPSKNVDLSDRFIRLCSYCLFGLFTMLLVYNNNILNNNNNNHSPTWISWSHQDKKQVIYNWWPYNGFTD